MVQATDGELGKVKDMYVDSENWAIRYLEIDTLKWLPGKKVLVSPISFDSVDLLEKRISIFATKEQIKNSPSVDEPITRKVEGELFNYYGWSPYWIGSGLWGDWFSPNQIPLESTSIEGMGPSDDEDHSYLRSMNEMKGKINGYMVTAKDGQIGKVIDFILDDESWAIDSLVIDTGDLLPGKKVVVSPEAIDSVNRLSQEIYLNEKKEEILTKSKRSLSGRIDDIGKRNTG
ncbi:PRC-barrel domain-containing protein [Alkalihalobacillus sp. MEB130]|uniref:PRC-barrel domain-containing protein n=1 Tax=Alkalihalobacillus sp. MEB130 TaxID=2976704 RepID=UPI0028DD4D9C|nr:PRC-barrel domain-containing protein [Alkalihalobacillus sp. MEB130]MDT8861943.1 PRC-barrel domain-containing protein [Alkalihalobacillus sp. MEB130]